MGMSKRVNSPYAYAAGMLAMMIPVQAFMSFHSYYYVETLGLGIGLATLARLIYTIWDALNEPMLGYLSDRTRTRFGRRKPWIYGALPFMALTFIMMFSAPSSLGQNGLFIWFLLALLLFETASAVIWVNYGALFPELYRGDRIRARASAIQQAYQIAALLVATAVTPLIYTALGFGSMAWIYAGLFLLLMWYCMAMIREREDARTQEPLKLAKAFRLTLGNRAFWIFNIANSFAQTVNGLISSMIPFYADLCARHSRCRGHPVDGGGVRLRHPAGIRVVCRGTETGSRPQLAVGLRLLCLFRDSALVRRGIGWRDPRGRDRRLRTGGFLGDAARGQRSDHRPGCRTDGEEEGGHLYRRCGIHHPFERFLVGPGLLRGQCPRYIAAKDELLNSIPNAAGTLSIVTAFADLVGCRIPDYLLSHSYDVQPGETYERFKQMLITKIYDLPEGVSEIYIHPAVEDEEMKAKVPSWEKRVWEYRLMLDSDFAYALRDAGVILTDYSYVQRYRKASRRRALGRLLGGLRA